MQTSTYSGKCLACSPKAFLTLALLGISCLTVFAQSITVDGKPRDWPAVLDNTSYIHSFKRDTANVSTSADDQFTQGSADPDPVSGKGGWVHNLGNTNNKTDITNAMAALYTVGSVTNLSFAADRTSNNGSAEIHTWFFRTTVTLGPLTGSTGNFIGNHTADLTPNDTVYSGDLLIISAFTQGGAQPVLQLYNWVGGKNPLKLIVTINPGDPTTQTLGQADVNSDTANVPNYTYTAVNPSIPWKYCTSSGQCGVYPVGTFFEANLNLTALNIVPCFATFLTSTRNSPSQNASLQDFAIDQFDATPPAPRVSITEATLCGTLTGPTLSICSPVNGAIYCLTQAGQSTPTCDTADGGTVAFTGLQVGKGFTVTANINGCISKPANCDSSTTCPGTTTFATSSPERNVPTYQIEIESPAMVQAVPNPFTDKVNFSLKSAVSGQGTLELYNMMGQKVHTVFQGYVEAGKLLTKEFNIPQSSRGNLIYIFRVGDQKATGKLINR